MIWAAVLAIGASAPAGAVPPSPSLSSPSPPPSASAAVEVLEAPGAAMSLEAQVDVWIAELAKDEAFASWRGATWRKAALGPGLHGWVVFVHGSAGEPVGYMIVGAKPEGGYALVEYGAGDVPLFSSGVLERAMASEGLEGARFTSNAIVERLYYDAMHAFWKVSEGGVVRYADAATGAWLPVTENDAARLQPSISPGTNISGKRLHIMKEPGDPYMSLAWLDAADAPVDSWPSFVAWLERSGGEAVYAGSAFGGAVLNPVGVAGYHWWPVADGRETGAGLLQGYVALAQEGMTRYAPLEALLATGSFR